MSTAPQPVGVVPEPPPTEEAATTSGVLDGLYATVTSAREVAAGFFALAALELRQAGMALVWMVACGIVSALLAVSAWLGLMAAVALFAIAHGVPWAIAVLALALSNAFAAILVMLACRRISRDLLFAATRRQLEAKPPAQ